MKMSSKVTLLRTCLGFEADHCHQHSSIYQLDYNDSLRL
jgi:hypothetical protein